MRLVLREAGWLVAVGSAVGILVTLAAGRMASSLLYGLKPSDPWILTAAVATLGLAGFVSSYVPARYAARLDPLTALRQE
jgi:ABC-type antimicrobial peptide transport system permease subunit